MTIVQTLQNLSQHLIEAERTQLTERRANDFLGVARAIMACRAHGIGWTEYADGTRLSSKVAEIL